MIHNSRTLAERRKYLKYASVPSLGALRYGRKDIADFRRVCF